MAVKTRKGYAGSKGERPNVSSKHKFEADNTLRLLDAWRNGRNPGVRVLDEKGNTIKMLSNDYWGMPPKRH